MNEDSPSDPHNLLTQADLDLLHGYLDGSLPDADFPKLQSLLRESEAARRTLRSLATVDSHLQERGAGQSGLPSLAQPASEIQVGGIIQGDFQSAPVPATAAISHRQRKVTWPVHGWAKVACWAILVAVAVWTWPRPKEPYATVYKSVGVPEMADGTTIRNHRFHIQAGAVELITQLGARVVIEAPASFSFESAQRLHLLHGRLSADVPPPAKGFTVITPTGEAVDLGTKFGVDVPKVGDAEVHVFQGEVIAQAKGSKDTTSLRHGEAMTMQHGSGTSRELRSAAFIAPEELRSLGDGLDAGQRSRAEAALNSLKKDPALISLLDFESNNETLPTGAYRITQGRWPGSRAPEFVNVGDHMKLAIGGEHPWPELTIAAWVRIDRLGAPFQSLYHTDGWDDDKPGQVHWMITRENTMRLALRQVDLAPDSMSPSTYPDSLRSVLPERGRWAHLAVVYNAEARTMRFYLNGDFDNELRLSTDLPARLGPAQIGNWDRNDRKLSGRVDELLFMGRAMSDAELRALYDAGNPYR